MKSLIFRRVVHAPVKRVWDVVSKVDKLGEYAPQIMNSRRDDAVGFGMKLTCWNEEGLWTESCTMWDPPQVYSFMALDNQDYFPYPIVNYSETLTIVPIDNEKSRLEYRVNYTPKSDIAAWFNPGKLEEEISENSYTLLANWEREILT